MTKTTCAQCGSARFYRSQCRHILERAAAVLGGRMCRCHDCNSRYLRLGRSMLRTTDLQRLSRRFALAAAMVVAALVVMLSILWFSRSQSNPASDTGRLRDVIAQRGSAC
jgi:uncharacterized membrane protein YidH (DUF202 family)